MVATSRFVLRGALAAAVTVLASSHSGMIAVAQQVAPEARIVYVDNDPVVLAHAHTLLRSTPGGSTAYVDGDARDPQRILAQAKETELSGKPNPKASRW